MAKKLAKSGRYAAVCASGLVIDGGIYRHDFVAQAVLHGIVQTSLETEVPVLSAVLTPHHFHDHAIHENFLKKHMQTKGKELAEACVSIVEKLSALDAFQEPRIRQ
jgi:6,7-dimethyl-8-ribityllumazine synthase